MIYVHGFVVTEAHKITQQYFSDQEVVKLFDNSLKKIEIMFECDNGFYRDNIID